MWFWRSSPRSLPASILDALRQTASLANAEEKIAPSSSRRGRGRAGSPRVLLATRAVYSAAVHKFGVSSLSRDNAFVLKEIKWLLKSADTLGAERDAAAHSPLDILVDDPSRFIAFHMRGNLLLVTSKRKTLLPSSVFIENEQLLYMIMRK